MADGFWVVGDRVLVAWGEEKLTGRIAGLYVDDGSGLGALPPAPMSRQLGPPPPGVLRYAASVPEDIFARCGRYVDVEIDGGGRASVLPALVSCAPAAPVSLQPAVGQWLHASCSQQYYGRISRVGKDGNGCDVVDIEVLDVGYAVFVDDDAEPPEGWKPGDFGFASLTEAEGTLKLVDVQYRMRGPGMVECRTPGNGCYRCKNLFELRDGGPEARVRGGPLSPAPPGSEGASTDTFYPGGGRERLG